MWNQSKHSDNCQGSMSGHYRSITGWLGPCPVVLRMGLDVGPTGDEVQCVDADLPRWSFFTDMKDENLFLPPHAPPSVECKQRAPYLSQPFCFDLLLRQHDPCINLLLSSPSLRVLYCLRKSRSSAVPRQIAIGGRRRVLQAGTAVNGG